MSDTKKVTPDQGSNLKRNNITGSKAFKLLSKENKAVIYLYLHGEADRWQIGGVVGDGYVPNVVHDLRYDRSYDLPMRRYDYTNKEGKPTWKGLYSLSQSDKELARELIGNLAND